jgi:hypothetical protein
MRKLVVTGLVLVVSAALTLGAHAQSSPNYTNSEHVANAGGNPAPDLTSSQYKITLSSIGDGLSSASMSSSSYQMTGGFDTGYLPPGEVKHLSFSDETTLTWDPEPSVGTYNLYRATLSDLRGGSYGTCLAQGLTTAGGTDATTPAAGECLFYLATAENRLAEEGTLGEDSTGATRPNTAPCP